MYLYTHIIGDFFLPTINVPGIGDVFADGFAEEQTLGRILAVLQNADNAQSPEAQQRLATSANNAASGVNELGKATSKAGDDTRDGANNLALGLRNATTASTQFGRNINIATGNITRSFAQVESQPFAIMQSITNMFGGLATKLAGTPAAGRIVGGIIGGLGGGLIADLLGKDGPFAKALGVGGGAAIGMLGPSVIVPAVAGLVGFLMDKLNTTSQAFMSVQKSGALLGGSFVDFRNNAHAANLTMGEFTNIFQKNGEAMASFGGQTNMGAREFARANKELNDLAGNQLRGLGFSFEDLGMATADMMMQFANSGIAIENSAIQTRAFAQATRDQILQTRTLSAITGRTIEQQKEAERAQRRDAQVQATLARLGPQQRDSVEKLISAFPQMREVILDQVQFGDIASKNALMMANAMPTTTQTIIDTVNSIKNGTGVVTDAFVQQAKNSEAIRSEFLDNADFAALSRFSNNEFLKTVEGSFLSLQKIMTSSINNVVKNVGEDLEKAVSGQNAATKALLGLQDANRKLGMSLSELTTEMLNNSDGLVKFLTGATNKLTEGINALSQMANIRRGTNAGPYNTEVSALQGIDGVTTAMSNTASNTQTLNNSLNQLANPGSTGAGTSTSSVSINAPTMENQLNELLRLTRTNNTNIDNLKANLT